MQLVKQAEACHPGEEVVLSVILELVVDCLLLLLASFLNLQLSLFFVLFLSLLGVPGQLLLLEVSRIGLYGARDPGASVDSSALEGEHSLSVHDLTIHAITGVFFAVISVSENKSIVENHAALTCRN